MCFLPRSKTTQDCHFLVRVWWDCTFCCLKLGQNRMLSIAHFTRKNFTFQLTLLRNFVSYSSQNWTALVFLYLTAKLRGEWEFELIAFGSAPKVSNLSAIFRAERGFLSKTQKSLWSGVLRLLSCKSRWVNLVSILKEVWRSRLKHVRCKALL